jgi:hypothetical protein
MKKFVSIPGFLALMCVIGLALPAVAQAPRFNSVAEKEAWIQQHPDAETNRPAAQPAPSDAPVYRNTGDKAADDAAYRSAKEAYARRIEAARPAPAATAAPASNAALTPRTHAPDPKKELKAAQATQPAPAVAPEDRAAIVRPTSGLPAGHPVYQDTGDPEADEATYARAKAAYHAAKEKPQPQPTEADARAEKARLLAEEDQRVRALEAEEARVKAAKLSNKSDQ